MNTYQMSLCLGGGAGRAARRAAIVLLAGAALAASPVQAAAGSGQSQEVAQPKNAATGYVIVGPVSSDWSTADGVDIHAAAVTNNSGHASVDQGLFLYLWATPIADGVPTVSPDLGGQSLGGFALGTLANGKSITGISLSGATFTEPPKGCYYVMLALLNGTTLVDVFPFNDANVADPTPTGYTAHTFGGAACAQTTPCENSAVAACLLSGRFQVTATYYNATDGEAQGQVLSFGGTRAQSDESVFYYFTDPSNFEMGVKILDACSITNTFWVFIGGLTNQGWTVAVLDTKTGNKKGYANDLNVTTVTTTDTAALPCP
jgi:hypothetical protein